ncbi:HK97 gp10 family phage protein [Desulfosporosinus nitroreducens]|uniref:HK97 gp10 family phage protein n=1 Tax=Desulfosporosinus nitroreducens TaxID=2018668 RepID=UPI00207C2D14|nr:HK97 gp10 family phage protein [Desulfosporosinus nitroreducens]MCO1599827.1 HK97 gp10 family phage protein [Desulfosporosinus nitroreducens]
MFEVEHIGLTEFRENITYLERNFPREAKRMLSRVGNKARTIVRRKARELVKRRTGNYQRSIKRGKVFEDRSSSGDLTVRVYSSSKIAPHGHLIERGHRIVDKHGNEHGFKQGYLVFDKSKEEIERDFDSIIIAEFDRVLSRL